MHSLRGQIKKHEGFSSKPYKCTAGKITIGYGRNLEDNGISEEEAEELLKGDINKVYSQLINYQWFAELDKVRSGVIVNMTFNLGLRGMLKFIKMINALSLKDYELAAKEMLNSKWARQVGDRATELAEQMRTGRYND